MKKYFGINTIVTPLPVLIIATFDEEGKPDAMNAAWGGQCGPHHIELNLSKEHQTTKNIQAKRAFTVSFGTEKTMRLCDYFGLVSGKKVDKFKDADVAYDKSQVVDAPVIREFPVTLECRVIDISEKLGEMHIVAEIANTLVDESVINAQGKIDLGKMRPIAFDSAQNFYRLVGEVVGTAYLDGMQVNSRNKD